MRYISLIILALSVLLSDSAHATPVKDFEIVVSIKPIHSLVCALTKDIAHPKLLLNSNFSPHHFQVTPSQVRTMQKAKVIIWIGPIYEKPLDRYLQKISAKILHLQDNQKIKNLLKPLRSGTFWDSTSCCGNHDHAHENHNNLDGHIWLDPAIMLQVIDVVVEYLVKEYPEHKTKLEKNAANYRKRLQQLHKDLLQKMAPYKGLTYIMQHDGNQYFDRAFATQTIATISMDSKTPPSVGHMIKLRQGISSGAIKPKCLFSERQLNSSLAKSYADVLKIKTGFLDYLGADVQPGEYAYEQLMQAYVDLFIRGVKD